MQIANHSTDDKVFIIAEVGNNHEGDFALAKKLIALAAEAGADAVKFQTIRPEELVSSANPERIAQLKRFEFSDAQFVELARVASEQSIHFMSTPFSLDAVTMLTPLVPAFKIASGDNNFYPLLECIAATGKPIIMSAGMAELDQIILSSARIRQVWSQMGVQQNVAILHCLTAYPTPAEEVNLRTIEFLEHYFPRSVGYSDHCLGIEAAVAAVAVGARIVEKHFTIDKNYSSFRDHQLSADPVEFAEMAQRIRAVDIMLGSASKAIAKSELSNLTAARRSIAAKHALPQGTTISMKDLSWVRPATGLLPGMESLVLGRQVIRNIAAGEHILNEDLAEV